MKPLIQAAGAFLACCIVSFFMLGWFMPFNKFKLSFNTAATPKQVVRFLRESQNHPKWVLDVKQPVVLSDSSFYLPYQEGQDTAYVFLFSADSNDVRFFFSDHWQSGMLDFRTANHGDSTEVLFYNDTKGHTFWKKCLLAWRAIWTIDRWKGDLDKLKNLLDRIPSTE